MIVVRTRKEAEMLLRCTKLNMRKYQALKESCNKWGDASMMQYASEGLQTATELWEQAERVYSSFQNQTVCGESST
jgi:hypothetical protein